MLYLRQYLPERMQQLHCKHLNTLIDWFLAHCDCQFLELELERGRFRKIATLLILSAYRADVFDIAHESVWIL